MWGRRPRVVAYGEREFVGIGRGRGALHWVTSHPPPPCQGFWGNHRLRRYTQMGGHPPPADRGAKIFFQNFFQNFFGRRWVRPTAKSGTPTSFSSFWPGSSSN